MPPKKDKLFDRAKALGYLDGLNGLERRRVYARMATGRDPTKPLKVYPSDAEEDDGAERAGEEVREEMVEEMKDKGDASTNDATAADESEEARPKKLVKLDLNTSKGDAAAKKGKATREKKKATEMNEELQPETQS